MSKRDNQVDTAIKREDAQNLIKREIFIQDAQRYSHDGEIPLNEPFAYNKKSQIFDSLLHLLFFMDGDERKSISQMYKEKFNNIQSKQFGHKNTPPPIPPKKKKDDHIIDYSTKNKALHEYIVYLNECINEISLKNGVNEDIHRRVWEGLANKNIATATITLLLSRLLKMEIDLFCYNVLDDKSTKKLNEVINFFKPNEVNLESVGLYVEREKSINTKVSVNSDIFGSFLQVYEQSGRRKYSLFTGKIFDERKSSSLSDSTPSSTMVGGFASQFKQFSEILLLERNAIVNLLLYIVNFYNFDIQEQGLLKILNEWKKVKYGEGKFNFEGKKKKKSVVTLLVDTTHKTLEYCFDFHSLKENERYLLPSINKVCPSSMFDIYNFIRLKFLTSSSLKNDKVSSENVLKAIIKHLSLPNANICNILSFLKYFFSQVYFNTGKKNIREHLLKIVDIAKKNFLKPNPIGGIARDLIILIKKELNFPNFYIRKSFENILKNKRRNEPKVIHVFFNKYCTNASNINRFDFSDSKIIEERIINTKANLVLNMLAHHLNNGKETKTFQRYDTLLLAEAYDKISDFLEKESENEKSNKNFIKSKLRDIVKGFEKKQSSAGKKKVNLIRDTTPDIPSCRFEIIELKREDDFSKNKRVRRIIPNTVYYNELKNLIVKAKKEKTDEDVKLNKPTIVNIAIAGGSGSVQRLAHAINICQNTKISIDVIINVYLLPLGENNFLSRFMAKVDPFYGRYVHNPICSRFGVFPGVNNKIKTVNFNSMIKGEDEYYISKAPSKSGYKFKEYIKQKPSEIGKTKTLNVPSPKYFMNLCLNNYIQNANFDLPIVVYSVQCLLYSINEEEQKKGNKVVDMSSTSFCQRLQIGYYPELLKYRKSKGQKQKSMFKIMEDKQFKFSPINLNISYVPMSIIGSSIKNKRVVLSNRLYNSIQIKNCSLEGDLGEITYPNKKYLEAYLEDTRKKKARIFEYDYDQTFRAGDIQIESNTHNVFSVLLDGELAGSFHRIIISTGPKNSTSKFNLKTFKKIE